MTDEQREQAFKEGERNEAGAKYFDARFFYRISNQQAFDAGFDRGWDAGRLPLLERIAELEAKLAQRVPDGWPTNEMIEAGRKAADSHGPLLGNGQSLWHIFRDMLSASPQPQPVQPSEQAAFEDWLHRVCPSGDVTEVQRQWEASSDLADWLESQAKPEQAAQPLTDEALHSAWNESAVCKGSLGSRRMAFIEGARFAEAARGIAAPQPKD